MANLRTEIVALANYADFSKDGKLSVSGVFDQIYAKKEPTSHKRGFLVITVVGKRLTKEKIQIEVISPDNQKLIEKEFDFVTGGNGKWTLIFELIDTNLPKMGNYKVSVLYNNKEIGYTNFEVMHPQKRTAQN